MGKWWCILQSYQKDAKGSKPDTADEGVDMTNHPETDDNNTAIHTEWSDL